MSRFYILKSNYCLRGYELLPYALLKRPENVTIFVNKDDFWALSLCDGHSDIDLPLYPEKIVKAIEKLEENGIVERCEYGSELNDDQKYIKYDNRFIDSVHISITGKCNYKCRHCYMSAPEAKLGEMSHEEIMDVLKQLADAGINKISLTGGEPLVRSDFEEIIAYITSRKMRIIQIYSNGFLVNEKLLDMLDKYHQKPEFNMSYDGDEGMHDWLRGIDRAGEYVLRAFDLCYERGFPTGSELCIFQKNKHLLRQSINTLAKPHVGSVKTNPVSETELWLKTTGKGQTVDIKELFDLYLEYIPHFFEDGCPMVVQLSGFFIGYPDGKCRFGSEKYKADFDASRMNVCGHARNQLYISADGRMLPCMSLSSYDEVAKEYPSVFETGIKKGLSESKYMSLIDTRLEDYLKHNPECAACEYRNMCCAGCRASALSTSKDLDIMAKDEMFCIYYKGGYRDKLRELLKKQGVF